MTYWTALGLLLMVTVGQSATHEGDIDIDHPDRGSWFDDSQVSIVLDMCSMMQPCSPAQNCTDVRDLGYICRCMPGYVGETCETECLSNAADIAFILDVSDSVTENDWVLMLHFVSSLIVQFDVDAGIHQIAVITFGNNSVLEFGLEAYNNTEEILENVRNLTHRQEMTNTSGALWMLRDQVFNSERRRLREAAPIGIILTDGRSTVDAPLTFSAATLAKEAGINMFAIGISSEVQVTELEAMATTPLAKHMFRVEDFRTLSLITNNILEYTCEVLPKYTPGHTGHTGPAGATGSQGVQGPQGVLGAVGATGATGPQGDDGEPGEIGELGILGDSGPFGPPGSVGAPGIPGAIGATGDQGATGDLGDLGEVRDGVEGFEGSAGSTGDVGAPGVYGVPGIPGLTGLQGATGLLGYIGTTGSTGHTGSLGSRGDRGPIGVFGPTGLKGHIGPIGFIYEDGNDCALNKSLCQHVCVNKRVDYECTCHVGFDLMDDGHSCQDRDECAVKNGGCEQFCHNLAGSYACSCTLGFTLSLDTKTCMDVDECCRVARPYACPDTHACLNTLGSFFCLHSGLIRDKSSRPTKKPVPAPVLPPEPRTSVFLRRSMMLGILIWLCALTILILIAVIVASSLSGTVPYVGALDLDTELRMPETYLASDRHVFPRLSLHPRPMMDPGMRGQDEINMDLTAPRHGSANAPLQGASNLYPPQRAATQGASTLYPLQRASTLYPSVERL